MIWTPRSSSVGMPRSTALPLSSLSSTFNQSGILLAVILILSRSPGIGGKSDLVVMLYS